MSNSKNNEKIVIGVVGLPGAGKSTALEVLKNIGKIVIMGDVVREEALKRNLPITGETLGKISRELREKYGPGIIAEKCIEYINKIDDNIIFIDGIRSMTEVRIFRKYWEFPIIAILCPDDLRYKRLLDRKREDDSISIGEIKLRDKRELEFGLKEVIDHSNYFINNNSDIETLKLNILNIVKIIIREKKF